MSAAPAGRPGAPAARRRVMTPYADRWTARVLATALTVAACDPSAATRGHLAGPVLTAVLAVAAWWAAPMVDERPVRTSMRWTTIALRRRTTLVAAGAVAAAAVSDPPVWLAACVTGLLLAYLLVTDEWTRGATAPPATRQAAPALIAAGAAAAVFLAALVPLGDTAWARLPAALALAATAACVGLALRHHRRPD